MRLETLNNIPKYSSFIVEDERFRAEQCLGYWMFSYLVKRHYNSPYGDIAPLVLANVLNLNIGIYEKQQNEYSLRWVEPDARSGVSVVIHKSTTMGDHYEGLKKPPSQQ